MLLVWQCELVLSMSGMSWNISELTSLSCRSLAVRHTFVDLRVLRHCVVDGGYIDS